VYERPGSNTLLVGTANGQVLRAANGDSDNPTWAPMSGINLAGDFVTAIAFAPSRPQQAYALTRGRRMFVCDDADGPSGWTAARALPQRQPGVGLAVSVEDERQLYAIGGGRVYRSTDRALNWTAVPGTGASTLPPGLDLRSIVAGPDTVYLAASVGVFMSPDAGQQWFPHSDGLPNVEIKELLWTQSDLFAVTHGRGLWHHDRYEHLVTSIDRILDPIKLWLAIHGGDPAPDVIRERIGRGFPPSAAPRH
jgi:hypothetical protein